MSNGHRTWTTWTLICEISIAIAGAGTAWGLVQGRVASTEEKVEKIEASQQVYVTKEVLDLTLAPLKQKLDDTNQSVKDLAKQQTEFLTSLRASAMRGSYTPGFLGRTYR